MLVENVLHHSFSKCGLQASGGPQKMFVRPLNVKCIHYILITCSPFQYSTLHLIHYSPHTAPSWQASVRFVMTTCRNLLVARRLAAPCECHRNYFVSSVLVPCANVSIFCGQLGRILWKWDAKYFVLCVQPSIICCLPVCHQNFEHPCCGRKIMRHERMYVLCIVAHTVLPPPWWPDYTWFCVMWDSLYNAERMLSSFYICVHVVAGASWSDVCCNKLIYSSYCKWYSVIQPNRLTWSTSFPHHLE